MDRLRAIDHLRPDMDVVASAEQFSAAIERRLAAGADDLVLVFVGLPGGSSSYFNLLIRRLDRVPGGTAIVEDERRLEFGTDRQRELFERSREAVRAQR
jgi:tRNA A37 N6-isopentenylltransferase MiaA